jgi:hypothetical protein
MFYKKIGVSGNLIASKKQPNKQEVSADLQMNHSLSELKKERIISTNKHICQPEK